MAVRPGKKVNIPPTAYIASGTVTEGFGVIFGAGDNLCINAGANGKVIGVAMRSGGTGDDIPVYGDGNDVPVVVGTGNATRGEFAIMAADGWTNQTLGGGNTVRYVGGQFLESGTVGQKVMMRVKCFAAGSA